MDKENFFLGQHVTLRIKLWQKMRALWVLGLFSKSQGLIVYLVKNATVETL